MLPKVEDDDLNQFLAGTISEMNSIRMMNDIQTSPLRNTRAIREERCG